MRRAFWFSIMFLLAAAAGVLAQDVRYNFDTKTDFSKFKTYKWVTIKGADQPNELVDKQIKDALDAELATKGLSKVDTETADLFIGYQTAIGQEKQFNSYGTNWGYGPGWGGWYGGPAGSSMTTGQTTTIYTGQLVLDMYDSANKDLVWRGIASKTLDVKAKPEKQQKNLAKAVQKLLKNYPPARKS